MIATLSDVIARHWFWAAMTGAVVLWYSTVTIYVAIRGGLDIKSMLARLKESGQTPASEPPEKPA